MNVPPRFSRRSTRNGVCVSIVCATISPRMICSVKFFEPIRIASARPLAAYARPPAATAPAMRIAPAAAAIRRPRVAVPEFFSPRSTSVSSAINRQGENGRGDRAGEDDGRIDHRQAAENVFAKPASANRRRDGRRADADHRGHANPGDD